MIFGRRKFENEVISNRPSPAPYGVLPPSALESISGYKVRVTWPRPYGQAGLIIRYFIKAHDQQRVNQTVVSAPFVDFEPEQPIYSSKSFFLYILRSYHNSES